MKTSKYYPVFLDLSDKLCLVVGGGQVAEGKVAGLLAEGARVTVVSPAVTRGSRAGPRRDGYSTWRASTAPATSRAAGSL